MSDTVPAGEAQDVAPPLDSDTQAQPVEAAPATEAETAPAPDDAQPAEAAGEEVTGEGGDGEDDGKKTNEAGEETTNESVGAGKTFSLDLQVEQVHAQFGTTFSWFFKEEFEYDVAFSVWVTYANSEEKEVVKQSSRCTTSKGSYTSKPGQSCKISFEWDNSFSYFNTKSVDYYAKITCTPDRAEAEFMARQQEEEDLKKKRLNAKLNHRLANISASFKMRCEQLETDQQALDAEKQAEENQMLEKKQADSKSLAELKAEKLAALAAEHEQRQQALEAEYQEKLKEAAAQLDAQVAELDQTTRHSSALLATAFAGTLSDLSEKFGEKGSDVVGAFAMQCAKLGASLEACEEEVATAAGSGTLPAEHADALRASIEQLTTSIHAKMDTMDDEAA